jgi:hypothetical protein
VLAEEEVAVVEGGGVEGDEEVVWAWCRCGHGFKGEALFISLSDNKIFGEAGIDLTGSRPARASRQFAGLLLLLAFWNLVLGFNSCTEIGFHRTLVLETSYNSSIVK